MDHRALPDRHGGDQLRSVYASRTGEDAQRLPSNTCVLFSSGTRFPGEVDNRSITEQDTVVIIDGAVCTLASDLAAGMWSASIERAVQV